MAEMEWIAYESVNIIMHTIQTYDFLYTVEK